MEENNEGMTPEEKLRMENEINKLKLQVEYGADFHLASDLPAEVESDFLKSIMAFEEQFKNRVTVKMYDFIGRPEFKNEADLTDEEITTETDRLFDIMEQNQVALDVLSDYDDRIIYKFLTEELFEYEMDEMRVPGMITHFTYEEFHPNHKDDLERYAQDFFNFLMKRDLKWIDHEAPSDLIAGNGDVLSKEQSHQRITDFINAWSAFENPEFEITNSVFNLDEGKAAVTFNCAYDAKMDDGNIQQFKGSGTFASEHKYGYWYMNKISMPGLQI